MANIVHKFRNKLLGSINTRVNALSFARQADTEKLAAFDTAIGTDNLGDCIIMHYCRKFLDVHFPDIQKVMISTHRVPTQAEEAVVRQVKYKFVCGTNLLTSNIENWWNWRLPEGYRGKEKYRNVILLGAGWHGYEGACSDYSRLIYHTILNPKVMHAVRDAYTLKKLRDAGINNVLNTGCPTMWALTPEFCRDIPAQKAKEVVATITDYRRDPQRDNEMLAILSRNYDHIHLWLQGKDDAEYLQTLQVPSNLTTVPASLEAYEEVLKKDGVDYVGTRLHAGIHALNHKVRSIIIAVDNRATEIASDTNLPVLLREEIGEQLESRIRSDWPTDIKIDLEAIEKFKAQFG